MLNNKKISLSDILRDFDKGLLGKTAEELEAEDSAPAYGLQPDIAPEPAQPSDAGYVGPDAEDEDDYEDEEDDGGHDEECECDVCNMRDAVDELADRQDEAVDAARALRDMADDYIEQHDEAIAKEASLFGEIFAKTACRYMGKNAGWRDDDSEDLEGMVKQAIDEAYTYTLRKLAAEEAFEAAAQAISDSASAARTLVENMGDAGASEEDPEVQAGQAAADAYNETMDRLTNGGDEEMAPTEDERAAAAQNGYDQASQQLADAQSAEPIDQQAASQNAYDQAMGQIQDQQQAPQGY